MEKIIEGLTEENEKFSMQLKVKLNKLYHDLIYTSLESTRYRNSQIKNPEIRKRE